VSILTIRGINEGNRTDISALTGALETFGDFKRGTSWNLGKEGAMQLMAITKLLREASLMYGDKRLATNDDPQKAVTDIKAIATGHNQPSAHLNQSSYASVAKRGMGGSPNQQALQKQKMSAELQQKQIFISMRNVGKDAPINKWEPAIITRYCNDHN
jgi:hypothetical protein